MLNFNFKIDLNYFLQFLKKNFAINNSDKLWIIKRNEGGNWIEVNCHYPIGCLVTHYTIIHQGFLRCFSYHKRKWMWFMYRILKMSLCVWDSWKGNILMAFKDHTINQWHWNSNVHSSDLFYSEKSHLK